MATPSACQKSLFRIAIIVSGLIAANTAFAAPTARLLPSSDLFALLAPAKAPSLMLPTAKKIISPAIAIRSSAHEAA